MEVALKIKSCMKSCKYNCKSNYNFNVKTDRNKVCNSYCNFNYIWYNGNCISAEGGTTIER